jgi:hypothetical protein
MTRARTIPTVLGLLLIMVAVAAYASDWYEGEYCDPLLGSCFLKACSLSQYSPAQIYENNRGYGDAQIIDQGGDRVDVIAQGGARLVFFRTSDSCKKFVGEQTQLNQQRQQQEQERLNKYR